MWGIIALVIFILLIVIIDSEEQRRKKDGFVSYNPGYGVSYQWSML